LRGQLGEVHAPQLTGIFSHFALHRKFSRYRGWRQQHCDKKERFTRLALSASRAMGIDPGIVHLANSAAIVTAAGDLADIGGPGVDSSMATIGYDPMEKRARSG